MADGRVAGVGRFDWEASRTIPLGGRTVIPGLIDTHMHLESTLLTPAELARLIVPSGTTAVISDSHEIGNVLGVAGIDMLASAAEGLPLDVFFMASSCVPATAGRRRRLDRPGRGARAAGPPARAGPGRGDGRAGACSAATPTSWPRSARPTGSAWPSTATPRASRPRALMAYAVGRDPLGPRVNDRRRGPGQGRARDARAGPRRVAGPEPRRHAAAARLRARSTSPGAWSPTISSPTTSGGPATSTGCSAGWSPAASGPRSPSATPRSSPPGIMACATVAPSRPATGPTWSWSTT